MFDIRENLKTLPDIPGVYIHKDKLGQVIYVGKAISLRNRVRQYFQKSYQNTSPKVKQLASQIAEFEYITCSSEMEALILECNLIKKYMPKYNVLLRDDKTYPYIMVTTSEKFPRIVKTRRLKKDGNRYFGPYSDVGAVNEIVDLLSDVYKLKHCSIQKFPKGHRPCLNYFIGKCRGVCLPNSDREAYLKDIDEVLYFLSGKDKPLINKLTIMMEKASEEMNYEEAAKYRDGINSVKALSEIQRVTIINEKDMDILLAVKDERRSFVVLFPIRSGKLSGRETFQIQTEKYDTKAEMIGEFIKQYYSQWASVPGELIVDELPEDYTLLENFLSKEGRKVKISSPKRGDKKALLDLTKRDVVEMTKTLDVRIETQKERENSVRDEVKKVIVRALNVSDYDAGNLKKSESKDFRVESYDISNTNGIDSVGAMVVFLGLKKVKKDYRRYKIRTVEGSDDYGSLQEILYRRYIRVVNQDKGFVNIPDLIMMDGGLGQVHAAELVLKALKIKVPVVGMAKDDTHRTRALVFSDGSEIDLKNHPVLFRYAGTIQEEVHRFAIDYHHNLHKKNTMHSALDDIPGIGDKRRNELLYHFKNLEAIRTASIEELMQVSSITENVAKNIWNFFHSSVEN